MMRNLTKVEWKELQVALLSVPVRQRTKAWQKASDFIERVLADTNGLAVSLEPDSIHYVPECDLCRQAISIDEDFVFKAITGTYRHYDCFHAPESPRKEA